MSYGLQAHNTASLFHFKSHNSFKVNLFMLKKYIQHNSKKKKKSNKDKGKNEPKNFAC